MERFNSKQLELLGELSKIYPSIMLFVDPTGSLNPTIYMTSEFRVAENNVHYHSIRGWKDITQIIKDNSLYMNSNNSLGVIVTRIDDIPIITKERLYSKQFIFIKF